MTLEIFLGWLLKNLSYVNKIIEITYLETCLLQGRGKGGVGGNEICIYIIFIIYIIV